jgi:hypothetical protein
VSGIELLNMKAFKYWVKNETKNHRTVRWWDAILTDKDQLEIIIKDKIRQEELEVSGIIFLRFDALLL